MFETTIGPVKEAGATVYLRPETAQGIFLDFKTVLGFARKKPPFGIAQVGKSFRNEITPGNFIFRTLEFEQMEMEFFVPPDEAQQWHEHWLKERLDWYVRLGIRPDHLQLRPHDADELSHYSSATSDVEYLYPIGWSELEGIANRGDFDLTQHAQYSGEKLEYFDTASGERYVPHVIEPAAGVGRTVLAVLCDAYDEEEVAGEQRTVLKLHPRLAPIKVAVLPLVRKDGQPELAHEVFELLRGQMQAEYDEGGSIGKRYRRQDEIGTPFCVTIDHQSLEDRTVTVRDRDSLEQERVAVDELPAVLGARLAAPWRTPKLGLSAAVAVAARRAPRAADRDRRRARGRSRGAGLRQRPAGRSRSARPSSRRRSTTPSGSSRCVAVAAALGAIPRALRALARRAAVVPARRTGRRDVRRSPARWGAPEVGVALLSVALVCGQTAGSLAADGVGLSPAGRQPVTTGRVAGVALTIAAVVASALGAQRAPARRAPRLRRRRRRRHRAAAGGQRPPRARHRRAALRRRGELRRRLRRAARAIAAIATGLSRAARLVGAAAGVHGRPASAPPSPPRWP